MEPGARQWLAARLTAVGRGAVATIRVTASRADGVEDHSMPSSEANPVDPLFQAASGIIASQLPLRQIAYGKWGRDNFEDLVVCRLSETAIEIHCHGGEAAVQRILSDLTQSGCRVATWREQQAAVEGVFVAECQEVLSRTTTWRTTAIVLQQTSGRLRGALERIIETSRRLSESSAGPPEMSLLRKQVDRLLRWAQFGLHLSTPWSVVLTGRPNVGKSSLINALLGYQRAIVFDQPGTTRDVVTGDTAFEGWPVVLADTAGIRKTAGELEAAGIALAQSRLEAADLPIVLIDMSQVPTADDFALLEAWPDALVVAHKSDLKDLWQAQLPPGAIKVSSATGAGLPELQRQLILRLVSELPGSEDAVPLTPRQIEILQEIQQSNTVASIQKAAWRLLN